MNFVLKKLLLVIVLTIVAVQDLKPACHGYPSPSKSIPYQYEKMSYTEYTALDQTCDLLKAGSALVAIAGATYLTGRFWQWAIFSYAQKRYEPEIDLLARAFYNDAVITQELIPYILERHADINSSLFWSNGTYRNYPLLKYKKDLDFYLNSLWLLSVFYAGSEKAHEINVFCEKLKRIRRVIVIDYRFIQEQREYDNRHIDLI